MAAHSTMSISALWQKSFRCCVTVLSDEGGMAILRRSKCSTKVSLGKTVLVLCGGLSVELELRREGAVYL